VGLGVGLRRPTFCCFKDLRLFATSRGASNSVLSAPSEPILYPFCTSHLVTLKAEDGIPFHWKRAWSCAEQESDRVFLAAMILWGRKEHELLLLM
jgi:hypothetical protein